MGRASVQIVIFLLCLNAVGGVLTASGVANDIGIEPDIGGDQRVQESEQAAGSLSPTQGSRDTLFGAFISIASSFGSVFKLVFYGPVMLSNVGLPIWMTTFPFVPATVIVAKDIAYIITGRDL